MRPATSLLAALVLAAPVASGEEAETRTCLAEVVDVEAVDPAGTTRVTLRAGTPGRERVMIYVGPAEGAAIARALTGRAAPRPMTHDLLAVVLGECDARITGLTVTSLREGVFIGELTVEVGAEAEPRLLDCRPSDGIALALAAGAPIRISTAVVEEAGLRDEPVAEGDEADLPGGPRPFGPPRGLI